MAVVKAAKDREIVVLAHDPAEGRATARMNGKYYDLTADANGWHVEALSSGAIYFVRVEGGRTRGCNCPAAKHGRYKGPCKHEESIRSLLAAW